MQDKRRQRGIEGDKRRVFSEETLRWVWIHLQLQKRWPPEVHPEHQSAFLLKVTAKKITDVPS